MKLMLVEDIFTFNKKSILNHLSPDNIDKINKHFGGMDNFLESYMESANLSQSVYFSDPNTYLEDLAPNLTENVRVIVKKVGEEPQVIELNKEDSLYEFKRKTVDGYIERIDLGNNIECWLNEEGKPAHLPMNFPLGKNDIVVGDVVFTNNNGYIEGLSDKQINEVMTHFKSIGYDYSQIDYNPDDFMQVRVLEWDF